MTEAYAIAFPVVSFETKSISGSSALVKAYYGPGEVANCEGWTLQRLPGRYIMVSHIPGLALQSCILHKVVFESISEC